MPRTKIKPKRVSKKPNLNKTNEVSDRKEFLAKKRALELVVQVRLLKDVVSSIVGVEAAEIVSLLSGKNKVNEFTIAEKLKITINQTRNILYKLSDEGFVSFIRKKEMKQ